MMERPGSRRLGMIDPLTNIPHVFVQVIQRILDQVLLAGFVFFVVQIRPILPAGVGAGNDKAAGAGPRVACGDSRTRTCGW